MSVMPPPRKSLAPGDVVTVNLPSHQPAGREQEGYRPAVVVGVPSLAGPVRFPVVIIVPLTTDSGQSWAVAHPVLYPVLAAGAGGLPVASICLADQVRSLDLARVHVRRGTLSNPEFEAVSMAVSRALPSC
ncbi:MAG: transcriptional modulator of MazE/toxin, MazF [Cyanobacteria bacterium RYN_339]|nr:transcriptional modulator of MazE/toxin, MazF [Cyanobacteria bacterium RYN_339]